MLHLLMARHVGPRAKSTIAFIITFCKNSANDLSIIVVNFEPTMFWPYTLLIYSKKNLQIMIWRRT